MARRGNTLEVLRDKVSKGQVDERRRENRERQAETQRDRHRSRQRKRETETHTERYRELEIYRQIEKNRQTIDLGIALVCQSDPTWYKSDPKSTSSRRLVPNTT